MNRTLLLLALAVPPAFSQTPAAPPPIGNRPGAIAPVAVANSMTSSRVTRVIAGPDGRAQGLLLRNGTYVNLSPGLSQQMPSGFSHNSSVRVSGPEFGSGSDKTIQAQQITIAGVAYNDVAGVGAGPVGPPPPNGLQAPPPPPSGGRLGTTPPPPPPPCGNGPVPPPPPPGAAALPPPPPQGASAPPPPATNGSTPPPPMPTAPAPPASGQPQPPTPPSVQN